VAYILCRAAILCGGLATRFDVTSRFSIRRLNAPLVALVLTIWSSFSQVHAVAGAGKVGVVSFGLFGDQGVFKSEATGAAQVVADRFETGPVEVEYNTRRGGNATVEGLARALQAAARDLDVEKDVLFLILTSHGSPDGLAIKAGRRTETLTPSRLGDMLAGMGVRHKVVVISACFSGVFVPRLASPDVLVITAADADHPSFGCQDKAKWTYFGDAFFNVALRKAGSLKDAFLDASSIVRKRELREHFEPSNPLLSGGSDVLPLLIGRH
jgi:Peptidase C13 family